MIRTSYVATSLKLLLLSLAGFLFACGGGGGSGGTAASTDTTITGSVVAAPVKGASVTVKDGNGNTVAGPVTTGADGTYSITIPNASLTGELMFESTGGLFKDEATGAEGSAGFLGAYVSADSLTASKGAHLTPASTIVRHLMRNQQKNHAQAQELFKNAFGFEADTSIAPVDVTDPPAGAGQARMLAGLRAAVFSMLNLELGLSVINPDMPNQFDLLPALAHDIADGKFDGQDINDVAVAITDTKSLPADVQNRYSHALALMHEETKGLTGLTNDQVGSLPFGKVAKTATYTVKYMPAKMMMNEVVGKSSFTLRITNNADGFPATGETVSLMPMMHMAAMNHATPSKGCTDVDGDGNSTCTLYYSMASSMMNGMSMGFWELKVLIGATMGEDEHGMPMMVGGETAIFYPDVKMAMGDTALTKLYGIDDKIMAMPMGNMPAKPEARTYYLFNEGVTGSAEMGYTFSLYIAAKENMMSFPGVSTSTVLQSGTGIDPLTVDPMVVQVCAVDPAVDDTCWVDALNDIAVNGVGHWSASGITGLVDTLYVRVQINGEDKAANENNYSTFTVSTNGMSM